jgi:hypothetical protein
VGDLLGPPAPVTPAARKQKAKQLAGLIEALDVGHLLQNRMAHEMLRCEPEQMAHFRDLADLSIDLLQLINTLAMEGPLQYDQRDDRLKQSAK